MSFTSCVTKSIHRLSEWESTNAVRSDVEVILIVLSSRLISMSLYRSLCCNSNEFVLPTIYDFVPKSARISNCCKGVYGPNRLPYIDN